MEGRLGEGGQGFFRIRGVQVRGQDLQGRFLLVFLFSKVARVPGLDIRAARGLRPRLSSPLRKLLPLAKWTLK